MRATWGGAIAFATALVIAAFVGKGARPSPVSVASAMSSSGATITAAVGSTENVESGPRPPAARAAGVAAAAADEDAAPSDLLVAVREAIATDTPASTATLMRALDSDDGPATLEAIEELAKRRHQPALARLVKLDPADDPFVGPTALLALGSLARDAAPAARDAAVSRLAELIAQEKARQGADSAGNLLVIFEALGAIGSESSARVLERELGDAHHGVAARVAIVEAIEACGRRSSVPALAEQRARFTAQATDPFERELEIELAAAFDRAIRQLSAPAP